MSTRPNTKKILLIDHTNEGQRLDVALSKTDDVSSRSRAQELISMGLVSVNENNKIKSSYKISPTDFITYLIPQNTPSTLQAQNIPLDIFFEDDHIIVINKPSGLVVHPAAGHENDTLVNALLFHCKKLSVGFNEDRPGIVHRIDKDTSGLLVVAKDDVSHQNLAKQFAAKTVHRKYWALCFGNFKNPEGRIETFIGRAPNERKKFSSRVAQGKIAITNYKVLATYKNDISLVSLKLETGRTHQIRVHLNDLHHPIIADWFYCNQSRLKTIGSTVLRKKISDLSRFALHAAELGFTHPVTGEDLLFKAPPPDSLKDLLTFCDFLSYV
ncbi:MAG: RluA family pseudouridine synthase [Bdellovibrionales bacterium]|nr:RluA family pseudouridine synthase [Bdellovibrionales bacterium]